VSIDSLQPMPLQQKFNIEKEHLLHNYLNSLVIAFDITTKVITAPLFGYFADRFGRKIINTYAILVIINC
jgi:MFS family permease